MKKRGSSLPGNRHAIGRDMLYRYSGCPLERFGKYILLTNFSVYMQRFTEERQAQLYEGSVLRVAVDRAAGVTMIHFNIGAPSAALVIDLLSAVTPKAVIMLGLCGGLHRSLSVGEFILPIAAVRNEGVSQHYMPKDVPSLPTFKVQDIIAHTLKEKAVPFKTGVVHSTDYRFWEFDAAFKKRLREEQVIAIEMECAAIFTVAFCMKVPVGALLLVSDLPLTSRGIKTYALQQKVFKKHLREHLILGIEALQTIKKMGTKIDLRHYEW